MVVKFLEIKMLTKSKKFRNSLKSWNILYYFIKSWITNYILENLPRSLTAGGSEPTFEILINMF